MILLVNGEEPSAGRFDAALSGAMLVATDGRGSLAAVRLMLLAITAPIAPPSAGLGAEPASLDSDGRLEVVLNTWSGPKHCTAKTTKPVTVKQLTADTALGSARA